MTTSFPDPETRALERYLRRPTRRRLAAVVRACQGHVWSVALRLAGHEEDAADLCQDVFLGLLHRPPPAGSVRSARGWLAARLATVARDRRRGAERRARRESLGAQRIAAEEQLGADEVEAVRRAVEELPERLRSVVELRYFAGLTNREVAAAVAIAEPTVDKDLRRARDILRRRLGKLAGALSLLAAASTSPAGAAVPAAIAGRWLQLVDWSPALFPRSATVLLETVIVKKTLAIVAAVLVLAVTVWHIASPPAVEPRPRVTTAVTPPTSPLVSDAAARNPTPAPTIAPKLTNAADPAAESASEDADKAAVTGSLRVKLVWTGDGTPAAGLGIEVWPRWCDNAVLCGRSGETHDDGVLVVEGLAPGRFSLRTLLGAKIGDRDSLADFEVNAGEETPLLLRVDDGITVRGIVVDDADRAVTDAALSLSAGAFDAVAGNVVAHSGPDGRFELRGVGTPGLYVSARASGHAPSSQLIVQRRPREQEVRLVLPAAGGAVHGRVLGPDRAPVSGAWVLVGARVFTRTHVAPAPPARARTDADGAFAVEGIAAGRAPVVVRAPSFAPAEAAVDVVAGRVADVVIGLEPGALLSGSVAGADGRPLGRVQVRLGEHEDDAYSSDFALLSTRTREDGNFTLADAAPGECLVRIDAGDRGRDKRKVLLAAGEETRIEVKLRAPVRLAGRVRYADGSPLVKAMVIARPGGRIEITDARGRFAFEGLDDQDYELSISEPRAQIAAVRRERVRPGPQEIEVIVADEERASGSVLGKVIDADGRPVRGAQVVGESMEAVGQAQQATTGFVGDFELERPAGTYRVRIDAEGHPRTWAGSIRVDHGQRVELDTVTIPRPGFLATSVTRLDGGPKEAVYFGVMDAEGRSALAVMLSSEPVRRDPLAPGKYHLIVRAPEAVEVVRELEIEVGEETRLDVEVGKP